MTSIQLVWSAYVACIQMGSKNHDHIVEVVDCHMGICTAGRSEQTVCCGGWEGGGGLLRATSECSPPIR